MTILLSGRPRFPGTAPRTSPRKASRHSSGSPRGEVTLLGGTITDFYGPFGTFTSSGPRSGYGRNFVYDARMLEGMSPPYFPILGSFISIDDGGLNRKLIWEDQG